jgi:hypothetical protein
MHGRHVRVGHVRHQADAGRKESRIVFGARNLPGELFRELSADGRNVDPDLFEYGSRHLAAYAAAARRSVLVGAVPWDEFESRVAACFSLDGFELVADARAQVFEPVAGGLLLVV